MEERVLPDGAIGWADELTAEQLAGKHIAPSKAVFETDEAYIAHTDPSTGLKPTDAESMGDNFTAVQKAALERAKDRGADEERQNAAIARVEAQEQVANEIAEKVTPAEEIKPVEIS